MISAVAGGNQLRIRGAVDTTGCFFAAQPARSKQNTPNFAHALFSLSRDCLSMATLVTRLGPEGNS
jgi:hypothetical protein